MCFYVVIVLWTSRFCFSSQFSTLIKSINTLQYVWIFKHLSYILFPTQMQSCSLSCSIKLWLPCISMQYQRLFFKYVFACLSFKGIIKNITQINLMWHIMFCLFVMRVFYFLRWYFKLRKCLFCWPGLNTFFGIYFMLFSSSTLCYPSKCHQADSKPQLFFICYLI